MQKSLMCWGASLALLIAARAAPGQVSVLLPVSLAKPAQPESSNQVKLTIHAAKSPLPALKYRLLPEVRDLKTGNAALLYYRAFSPEWATLIRHESTQKALEQWSENIDKAPPDALRFVLDYSALKEIDRAARRSYCEWEMADRLRREGIAMLLPDVQGFRNYLRLLSARARFEMLEKNYDKAAYTLQTGFAFSSHVSDGPTLIQALVGAAMAQRMIREVEVLIQKEKSPNLYWALTNLPKPFIDLRTAIEGEKIMFDNLFPGLRDMVHDVDKEPLTPGEVNRIIQKFFELSPMFWRDPGSAQHFFMEKVGFAVLAAKNYPHAKQFLLDQGRPEVIVNQMPITQVALLYEIYNYDRYYDDIAKWWGLPYPQARRGIKDAYAHFKEQVVKNPTRGVILAKLLLPAMERVLEVSYRMERKIAALRCVEALRLYAAEHDGKLPPSLEDIKEVPVPDDPYTGELFEYRTDGNTATITAPVPPGERPYVVGTWGNTWSYQLTIKQ